MGNKNKQKYLSQMPLPDKKRKYYMEKVSTEYPKLKLDPEDEIKEIDKRIMKRNQELDNIYADYDEYIKEDPVEEVEIPLGKILWPIAFGVAATIVTGGNLFFSIPLTVFLTLIHRNSYEDNK